MEIKDALEQIQSICLEHANPYEDQGMVFDFNQIYNIADELLEELENV